MIIFAYGLILVRVAGRRVFGKWAALDIIVSIIVGSNLSRTLTGGADFIGTLAATTLLLALHWLLANLVARSAFASSLLEGTPIHISTGGERDEVARLRHTVSEADLREALHQSGLREESATRLIVLEPSGKNTALKE